MLSDYGSLQGVPLPVFAAWFYAFLALNVMFVRRGGAALMFLLSIAPAALSLWLAGISFLALRVVCVLCAMLYAINLALLIASAVAIRQSGASLVDALLTEVRYRLRRPGDVAAAALGGLFILPPVFIVSRLMAPGRPGFCDLVTAARPAGGGPMTLVVYSDFQCRHCRALDRLLRPLRKAQGLEFIPQQYPLDRACNPKVTAAGHAGSCLQARAALCARRQGRYDEMSDRLYDDGPTDEPALRQLASSLQLDPDQFADCVSSAESSRELAAEIAAAHANDVRSTPTLVLNGRTYRGRPTEKEIECLITSLTQ